MRKIIDSSENFVPLQDVASNDVVIVTQDDTPIGMVINNDNSFYIMMPYGVPYDGAEFDNLKQLIDNNPHLEFFVI